MSKFFSVGLFFVLAVFIGFVVLSLVLPPQEIIIKNPDAYLASLFRPESSKITIFAVGDIMLDRGVQYMIDKEGDGDYKFPFLKIGDELKKSDILFGNLEGPISDKGQKVGSIYSFRADPKVVEGLEYAGFDVLSLANNHMFDYQGIALEDTMRILKEKGMDYIGAGFNENEAFSLKIKEIKNTKIGFLAYTNLGPESWKATEERSGMAWISEKDFEAIEKDVEEAKKKTDILIISLHSGVEYSTTTTRFQTSFAKACIDAGADLVLGHHPHVIQRTEKYKDGWIAYSLGNFVFDQGFSEETMEGLLLEIIIEDKEIKELNHKEVKISEVFQPYFKGENTAVLSSFSKIGTNALNLKTNKASEIYLKDFDEVEKKLILDKESFIKLNLDTMKAYIYQEGKEIKEFSIAAKGDPDFWGGVPTGLYSVISRNIEAFSGIAEVYMPYSVHFYGKYFIHGEPYYPNGTPLSSSVSGGCVRLLDEDAKAIYEFAERGMPILVTDRGFENDNYKYSVDFVGSFPKISSKSYLVADIDSGYVFSQNNSQSQLPIASLTKLTTVVSVIEHIDLRKSILVTEKMLEPIYGTQGLLAGERYRIVELLYPTLIESSNDAAEILSYFLGKEKTIKLMNEKAEAIGMSNTRFVEPTGLSKDNVSTAQDLFHLGRYIFNVRPPMLKIAKGEEVASFGPVRFSNLNNRNILFDYSDFLGGKTGYIKASNYTGLFSLNLTDQDGQSRNISIILLDSDNLKNDLFQTLKWLKENYFVITDFEILEKILNPLKTSRVN